MSTGNKTFGQVSSREQGGEEGASPGKSGQESRWQGRGTIEETARRQSRAQYGRTLALFHGNLRGTLLNRKCGTI